VRRTAPLVAEGHVVARPAPDCVVVVELPGHRVGARGTGQRCGRAADQVVVAQVALDPVHALVAFDRVVAVVAVRPVPAALAVDHVRAAVAAEVVVAGGARHRGQPEVEQCHGRTRRRTRGRA